jgi:hypothetical protein
LYLYINGFSTGGTQFYVQDFQLVAAELPFELGVHDGQFLKLLLSEVWQDSFEEIGKDILATVVAEQEFEGEIDFGEHDGHGMNIAEGLGKGKCMGWDKSLHCFDITVKKCWG